MRKGGSHPTQRSVNVPLAMGKVDCECIENAKKRQKVSFDSRKFVQKYIGISVCQACPCRCQVAR